MRKSNSGSGFFQSFEEIQNCTGHDMQICLDVMPLRQSFGQNSIFFNNAQNELKFDSKHCFCDLNIKMAPF